jgi:exodeoxyribonuclease VII large subunit
MTRAVDRARERLISLSKLHGSVDPSAPLKRGFARVHRMDGGLVREGAGLSAGEDVRLVFADMDRKAVIDGAAEVTQ